MSEPTRERGLIVDVGHALVLFFFLALGLHTRTCFFWGGGLVCTRTCFVCQPTCFVCQPTINSRPALSNVFFFRSADLFLSTDFFLVSRLVSSASVVSSANIFRQPTCFMSRLIASAELFCLPACRRWSGDGLVMVAGGCGQIVVVVVVSK